MQLTKYIEYGRNQLIVLIGRRGIGKKTLATKFAEDLKYRYSEVGNKVGDIRELIDTCYTTSSKVVYNITNGGALTISAQNALLKLCEEPPKNARIIICCEYTQQLVPTLLSRAYRVYVQPPERADIQLYVESKFTLSGKDEKALISSYCQTYSDVDTVMKYGGIEFIDFCELVVFATKQVSTVNYLKLADKIKLKDTEPEKYDMLSFLTLVKRVYEVVTIGLVNDIVENNSKARELAALKVLPKLVATIDITNETILELVLGGANKKMLLDNWAHSVYKVGWNRNGNNGVK